MWFGVNNKEMRYVSLENFNVEDIFGELVEGELPDGQGFEKIPNNYQHSDDEVGPLAILLKLTSQRLV